MVEGAKHIPSVLSGFLLAKSSLKRSPLILDEIVKLELARFTCETPYDGNSEDSTEDDSDDESTPVTIPRPEIGTGEFPARNTGRFTFPCQFSLRNP